MRITEVEFEQFRKLMLEITGVSLTPEKATLVESRLSERLRLLNLNSFRDYYKYITLPANRLELDITIDKLTTHETYFFREPDHFDYLKNHVLANWSSGPPFKLWCGAASTGEEPYTLAMVLTEGLGVGRWQMLATDVSKKVIKMCERGHYPMSRAKNVEIDYLKKYCLKGVGKHAGSLLMEPDLKANIRFDVANLLALPDDIGSFDTIFLRNVLIYFENDVKKNVLLSCIKHLNPGGYLFVGHAESISQLNIGLTQVATSIYVKE